MAPSATGKEVPERGFEPGVGRGADAVRSRKETLSSPIPALLATSMGDVEEGPVDADSIPVLASSAETSRQDAAVRQALVNQTSQPEENLAESADEDGYQVEIDPLIK